ncbi:MAG TPA: tripartite tricarboxylate transporter substrate binding protein [Desulfosalsimonadaceae bacterium]|nr:tripartite tricarboxylate transporter substrate binding protein [Desulfosalsimonadaceae bacterium]
MKAQTRIFVSLISCFALFFLFAASAGAQSDYPNRPIQCVVTYSPGGATDLQARIVTMMAEEELGQPIAIINKPGAGGLVGWNWVVSSAKTDGYTMSTYNIPHFIAQSIVYENAKYDIDSFEPVANWGSDPAVLVVHKDSQFDTLEDLVQYAKKNPGMITVSGAGKYVGHHIALLQLQEAADIQLTYIPMKGGVPALQAVVAQDVEAGFNNLSDAYRSRDKLNVLAIADTKRNKEFFPKVKTFQEQGYDEVDDTSVNRRGIVFPEGVDKAKVEKCAKAFPKMFKNEKVQEKMRNAGCPMEILTRDEVKKMFKEQQKYLKSVLGKFSEEAN